MTQENFRTKVFNRAREIQTESGKTWAVSLVISWRAYRLIKRMRKGEVMFAFEKKDGSLRYAKGTLSVNNIPQVFAPKGIRRDNYKSINYFDIEKQEWRSFKTQNLLSVYEAND